MTGEEEEGSLPMTARPQVHDGERKAALWRKKPVVIEAYQLTRAMIEANLFDGAPMPHPLRRSRATWNTRERRIDRADYAIKTLEGIMYAIEGDWIIKGIAGEFYPCKPDIFDATYEAVPTNPSIPERG